MQARACDLVALPFERVLNSGSLLLAMSFGRCVVAPNVGSLPEVASHAAFFGYDVGLPNGLTFALQEALGKDDLAERGRGALEHVRTNFGWDEIARAVSRLYSDLSHR